MISPGQSIFEVFRRNLEVKVCVLRWSESIRTPSSLAQKLAVATSWEKWTHFSFESDDRIAFDSVRI